MLLCYAFFFYEGTEIAMFSGRTLNGMYFIIVSAGNLCKKTKEKCIAVLCILN